MKIERRKELKMLYKICLFRFSFSQNFQAAVLNEKSENRYSIYKIKTCFFFAALLRVSFYSFYDWKKEVNGNKIYKIRGHCSIKLNEKREEEAKQNETVTDMHAIWSES